MASTNSNLAGEVNVRTEGPARILLAAREGVVVETALKALAGEGYAVEHCPSSAQAASALLGRTFDLVLLDPTITDGESLELARLSQRLGRTVKVVLLSARASFERAVEAMRCGAVDYIRLPFEREDFLKRVAAAIGKGRVDQEREQRLTRLKRICRKLNSARHEISEQVDVLCSDLAAAYKDLTDQMQEVATASEFRTLLRQELDVESLLRTTLEYVLAKTGPTNAAVFLPGPEGEWNLGAYVNYDCPRETASVLLDHLGAEVCPMLEEETEIVRFEDAAAFAKWIGMESDFLADSQVIAFTARHEDEPMAVVVMFRRPGNPFGEEVAGLIELLRDIFAEQLATVIRVHHRATVWPEEAFDDDAESDGDYGLAA
jgi:DNA-binding response OmpR family regulator